jgi:virulence-associated protein VagC
MRKPTKRKPKAKRKARPSKAPMSKETASWADAPPIERQLAKVFWTGRSQAVRLPKEFRFVGDTVLIRRVGNMVVLEEERDKNGWPKGFFEWLRANAIPDFEIPPDGPPRDVDL